MAVQTKLTLTDCLQRVMLRAISIVVNLIGSMCTLFLGFSPFCLSRENILKKLSNPSRDLVGQKKVLSRHLDVVLDCLDTEDISYFGHLQILKRFVSAIEGMVRVERFLSLDSTIQSVEIKNPVFIISMTRTGSTLLHKLLACDPQFYSPSTAEMLRPTPAHLQEEIAEQRRQVEKIFRLWFNITNGNISKVHDLNVDAVEEANTITGRHFVCLDTIALTIRRFSKLQQQLADDSKSMELWISVYSYLRSVMQLLVANTERKQCTYLMRHHVNWMNLDAFLKVFPDARFIMTHRRPAEFVPSTCSMFETFSRGYRQELTARQRQTHGRNVMRHLSEAAKKYLNYRTRLLDSDITIKDNSGNFTPDFNSKATTAEKEATLKQSKTIVNRKDTNVNQDLSGRKLERIVDINYSDLVCDPLATIKASYKKLGLHLSDVAAERMRGFIEKNPRNKHGKHSYCDSMYGLDNKELEEQFGEYCEMFNIN